MTPHPIYRAIYPRRSGREVLDEITGFARSRHPVKVHCYQWTTSNYKWRAMLPPGRSLAPACDCSLPLFPKAVLPVSKEKRERTRTPQPHLRNFTSGQPTLISLSFTRKEAPGVSAATPRPTEVQVTGHSGPFEWAASPLPYPQTRNIIL